MEYIIFIWGAFLLYDIFRLPPVEGEELNAALGAETKPFIIHQTDNPTDWENIEYLPTTQKKSE